MRSSLAGIFVVALSLTCASCGNSPAPAPVARQATEKSPLEPILGAIDAPARDSVLKSGPITAGGWAIAESGVKRVVLYIDKQFVGYATVGGNRPDIVRAFASFPDTSTSGWNAIIDVSAFPEGDHQMALQVESKAGNVHDFPVVPFKIR